MSINMNACGYPKLDIHSLEVLQAVKELCFSNVSEDNNTEEKWPSTRDIAEYCNFNIYKTRYILLKLMSLGLVYSAPNRIKNSLRWTVSRI